MHRKHECGAQIFGCLAVIVLVLCCQFSLFAKNIKQAPKEASSELERNIEEKNAVLDSIKMELEKGREKLQQLQTQEGTVITQLSLLETNISTSELYLREMSVKIDSTARTIGLLSAQLSLAEHDLLLRKEIMKRRLRALYKSGELTLPDIVLSSNSMSDVLHKVRYFNELNLYDRRLIASIDSSKQSIETKKTVLEKHQRKLANFKRDKETEFNALLDEQQKHKKILGDVRDQKNAYMKMVRELETAQKELQNIVAMLEKNKHKKVPAKTEKSVNATFEKEKGHLPWPVKGKIVMEFGRVVHSVYKTVTMNTGIDIACAKGDKARCVAAGKVAYIGWMRGLGKLVIIDHGGYYSTYARLEDALVAKDDNVEAGSVIGLVGEINSMEEPKLHFELRKSTEAIDPVAWLEDGKR